MCGDFSLLRFCLMRSKVFLSLHSINRNKNMYQLCQKAVWLLRNTIQEVSSTLLKCAVGTWWDVLSRKTAGWFEESEVNTRRKLIWLAFYRWSHVQTFLLHLEPSCKHDLKKKVKRKSCKTEGMGAG